MKQNPHKEKVVPPSGSPHSESSASDEAKRPAKRTNLSDLQREVTKTDELERKYFLDSYDTLIHLLSSLKDKYTPDEMIVSRPVSVYYDTKDWDLRKTGASLRMRYTDPYKSFIQTPNMYQDLEICVKTDGKIIGKTVDRDEFEDITSDPVAIAAKKLDFSLVSDPRARKILENYKEEDFRKIFVTVVNRYAFKVPLDIDGHKVMVELAFDSCEMYFAKGSLLHKFYQDKKLDHRFEVEIEIKPEESDQPLNREQALLAIKMFENDIEELIPEEFREDNLHSKAQHGFTIVKKYLEECGFPIPAGAKDDCPFDRIHNATSGKPPVPFRRATQMKVGNDNTSPTKDNTGEKKPDCCRATGPAAPRP